MIKKDWIQSGVIIVVTLAASLGVIRWQAPQLLGVPVDLQMVQISKEVPPFYENIFRDEDFQSMEYLLQDPVSGTRAKPLLTQSPSMGPNDVLGFRNFSVPNLADILVVGDSQTYGNNAPIINNWPHQMQGMLHHKENDQYSMAVGGWGAVQYYYAVKKGISLKPRIIVVAFYTGNDSLDSFRMAYNYDMWAEFRVDPDLKASDIPAVPTLSSDPEHPELWPVRFGDAVSTVFSPKYRHATNQDHPAVNTGYDIMAMVAQRIVAFAQPYEVQVVFTIIPTKELVYEKKIELDDGVSPTEDYLALLAAEKKNILKLSNAIKAIPNAIYVDVIADLQRAALNAIPLYPPNVNGHPIAAGYNIIATSIAKHVAPLLPNRHEGLYAVKLANGEMRPALVRGGVVWSFLNSEVFRGNGWSSDELEVMTWRDLEKYPIGGEIGYIDRELFGPRQ